VTRRVIVGSGAVAIALCGVIAIELGPAPYLARSSPHRVPFEHLAIAGTQGAAADQTQALVSTSLGRPLFEPSRRPPESDVRKASHSGIPRLSGIVITPIGRSAIFESKDNLETVVSTGAHLDGFLVQSIGNGSVLLIGPSGPRIIEPTFKSNAPSTGTTAVSPSASLASIPSTSQAPSPFASLRGLTGRPLGLIAHPDEVGVPSGNQLEVAPRMPDQSGFGASP
jgi:hypothetical protein